MANINGLYYAVSKLNDSHFSKAVITFNPWVSDKLYVIFEAVKKCLSGGIGRRVGFKIRSWFQGAGSSPASGTYINSVCFFI